MCNHSSEFNRVMSGIITGPYFENYFQLGELQLGTMVAVLEIGALSTLSFHIRRLAG